VIDQRVNASVFCEIRPSGFMAGGTCSAQVSILRAPEGKLDALVRISDDPNLPRPQLEPQWKETQQQMLYKQGQDNLAAVQRQSAIGMQRQKSTFDAFMATSQQNHQAFMAQQESRFQSSMNNVVNSMNARSTAASDMIDYSLDQQTVVGQGGVAKVSSAYSQTWSNTVGNQTQWYQTDDPNSNPNGVLPGNWTQDTKVHGNGTSY
jgi:hypothetical protein